MSPKKREGLVQRQRPLTRKELVTLPAVYQEQHQGHKPHLRESATDGEKQAVRHALLSWAGFVRDEQSNTGWRHEARNDVRLERDFELWLDHAEAYAKAERAREPFQHRAGTILLCVHDLRRRNSANANQKMPPDYYQRRAMELGAALCDAGVYFEAGRGGRKPGTGAHDNEPIFRKALPKVLARPGEKGVVFEELAAEEIAAGRKHGDRKIVGADIQKRFNRWFDTLTPGEVSIISNQMTCPTCGTRLNAPEPGQPHKGIETCVQSTAKKRRPQRGGS